MQEEKCAPAVSANITVQANKIQSMKSIQVAMVVVGEAKNFVLHLKCAKNAVRDAILVLERNAQNAKRKQLIYYVTKAFVQIAVMGVLHVLVDVALNVE